MTRPPFPLMLTAVSFAVALLLAVPARADLLGGTPVEKLTSPSEQSKIAAELDKRADALADKGQHKAAIAHYVAAIRLHDAPDYRQGLGMALINIGDDEHAFEQLDLAIKADGREAGAYNLMGFALIDGNLPSPDLRVTYARMNRAIRAFDKALQLDASYHNAHYGKALAYKRLKQAEKARASIDRAIALLEKDVTYPGDVRANLLKTYRAFKAKSAK